jgi:enterochelin esterase-like enzyme
MRIIQITTMSAIILASSLATMAQLPAVSTGTIKRFENFSSKYVTPRHIDVWMPADYSKQKKYNVLYMHDGQMLFDASSTWNKSAWEVDDVVSRLLREKKIRDVIVVGIWNGGNTRHVDYFPQKPFESLSSSQQDSLYAANRQHGGSVFQSLKINSDNYLKFLVDEVIPLINENFFVKKGRDNTFVMGSSMGGLISLYAICEYPEVFGGAACLSTHWPGVFTMENNPVPAAFFEYMKRHLPDPKTHTIYFDYGTETLDAMYPPLQATADEVMKARGFNGKRWVTREFRGEDHSEKAWSKRLNIPLEFLLKK